VELSSTWDGARPEDVSVFCVREWIEPLSEEFFVSRAWGGSPEGVAFSQQEQGGIPLLLSTISG